MFRGLLKVIERLYVMFESIMRSIVQAASAFLNENLINIMVKAANKMTEKLLGFIGIQNWCSRFHLRSEFTAPDTKITRISRVFDTEMTRKRSKSRLNMDWKFIIFISNSR